MLTLADIISHYKASASPSRVPDCTLWTWLHLAHSVWESGATVRNMGGRGRSLTPVRGLGDQNGIHSSLAWSLGTEFCGLICVLSVCVGGNTSICSIMREGLCRWNEQWCEGGRPVGKSFPWERGVGDVTVDRVFQKAKRGDGTSCPLAAAAFCWRLSSVIPIQFYGLWEFIIQLHLCLLAGIKKRK